MAKSKFDKKKKNKKDSYLYIGISLIFLSVLLFATLIVLISCQSDNENSDEWDYSLEESSSLSTESSTASQEESSAEPSEEESSVEEPKKEGWIKENGKTYYYQGGNTLKGLVKIDGKLYIFQNDGSLNNDNGFVDYQNEKYYITNEGNLVTGWLEDGGHKYYFNSQGEMAKGQVEIDGKRYFFTESGKNFILVNPWNYIPEDYEIELVKVSTSYAGNELIEKECYEALKKMIDGCRNAGYNVYVVDGYRTNDDQAWLFNRRVNSYISQGYSQEEAYNLAKEWSAVPGTSEHEMGLALDIIDTQIWDLCEEQETLAGQQWLMANCWKYGFILRYPKDTKDQTGINYEPWHYRYLGVDIATEIYNSGLTVEAYIQSITE